MPCNSVPHLPFSFPAIVVASRRRTRAVSRTKAVRRIVTQSLHMSCNSPHHLPLASLYRRGIMLAHTSCVSDAAHHIARIQTQPPALSRPAASMAPAFRFGADGASAAVPSEAPDAGALTSSEPQQPPASSGDFQREWRRNCPTPDVKYRYVACGCCHGTYNMQCV